MKTSSYFWFLWHPFGLKLLWIELVGDTGNSFDNSRGPRLASLLDICWAVQGSAEFSAAFLRTQIKYRVDGR